MGPESSAWQPTQARADASKQVKSAAWDSGSLFWRQDEIWNVRTVLRSLVAAGCLALLFAAPALRAQETKEKVTVDDVDRNFMVRLPKGYDPQQHYPVVILLHGMNQDPEDMERLTRFNELADKDGIIAIYPSALHGRWNVGVRPEERRPMAMGPGRGGAAADPAEVTRAEAAIRAEAVVIPEGVGDIRGVADNSSPRVASRARRNGPLRRMTSLSSTRCWTSWR